jgi:hypothetical protein
MGDKSNMSFWSTLHALKPDATLAACGGPFQVQQCSTE